MPQYDFGQPRSGVIQMAYIVPDIQAAMRDWVARLGVGPWFHLDRITGIDPVYRGKASRSSSTIAMAYAGHMQIELIQPLDEEPSVFRETIEARGYGFHHVGLATHAFEADIAQHEAEGRPIAFRAGVPTGGSVAYVDDKGALPGFIELIEMTDQTEAIFTHFYRASVGWDGADPIRSFG